MTAFPEIPPLITPGHVEDLETASIDLLDLSVRAYNLLTREGIKTLAALTATPEQQLRDLRMMRPHDLWDIKSKLHLRGLRLTDETLNWVDLPADLGLKEGYLVSEDAQVKSPQGKILKPSTQKGRKLYISVVMADGRSAKMLLDVLVLSGFSGYLENYYPVHADSNADNCHIDNLTWSIEPRTRRGRKRKTLTAPVVKPSRRPKNPPMWGPKIPAPSEVKVFRAYQAGDVMAAVSDDGSGSVSVSGTTMSLDPAQLRSLIQVAARIDEINKIMGI